MEPLPKLFDPRCASHSMPFPWGMAVLIVGLLIVLGFCRQAKPDDKIPFSLLDPTPVVSQSESVTPIKMSIHAAHENLAGITVEKIPFALYQTDASAPPKPEPLVEPAKPETPEPPSEPEKPECSPARTLNRVVLLHATKTITTVKICTQQGCRLEERVSDVAPPACAKLMADLKKLSSDKKWSAGSTECDHFWLVDVDDPKNAKLVKSLDVKRTDLPLLVKESNVEYRKKAAGMKAHDLLEHWNKWFLAPKPDEKVAAPEQCVPTTGDFLTGPRWDYTGHGTLRQHLTDPRAVHHLPAAVVEQWSDSQVQTWHNWHHEVLSGRRRVASPSLPKTSSQPSAKTNSLDSRVRAIALSEMRAPPSRLVAAAGGSEGRSAQKKPSASFGSGNRMSVAG